MLEGGLFFLLGFLVAALLALVIAPSIWRRAVVLTRRQIENSVPLSLTEIQAEKDQLRAEFAMSTRRLEVVVEETKARAADQLIDISTKRGRILDLEDELSRKTKAIAETEMELQQAQADLVRREERLSNATSELQRIEARFEDLSRAHDDLNHRHERMLDELDGQKIEIVARETKLDSVADIADVANRELRAAIDDLQEERDRNAELTARLRELSESGDGGSLVSQLEAAEQRADARQREVADLKAELADMTLRMNAMLDRTSGKSGSIDGEVIARLKDERADLRHALAAAEAERDELKREMSAAGASASNDGGNGSDIDEQRRENAIIRERISDIAAQVTAMTAALEGEGSPIHTALDAEKANGSLDDGVPTAPSLADRIRALQKAVGDHPA